MAGPTPILELKGVSRRFGEVVAVDRLSLSLAAGEFLTLLGPSGCGKTTALRLIAGFEDLDQGAILFQGTDVSGWSPQRRGFGMVFQNYALFPHLNVFENVGFGLRSRKAPREAVAEGVRGALARVDLTGYEDRPVQALSGGQQQRVALARALAIEPPLLLLDEPLSNLDQALRVRTRTQLRSLVKELGITALFVTHDQEEAFDLSDRIAVMEHGRLRQVGTPDQLYRTPSDRFVAGFVGRANPLLATLESPGPDGRSVQARLSGGTLWPLGPPASDSRPLRPGEEVTLVVRPEDLHFAAEGEEGDGLLEGRVRDRRFRGPFTVYRVETAVGELEVVGSAEGPRPDERVALRPRPDARLHCFPREDGAGGTG